MLVLIADDAGWNDVGYHGSKIKTPNIDYLADNGIKLNRFYVAPTCSPTRAALLIGMPASRIGIIAPISGKSTKSIPDSIITLPQQLQKAGYKTALIGKWHLGLTPESGPNAYGFSYSYGFLHGQIDQYSHTYKNGDQSWHRNGHFIEEQGHATDLITREAIRWLKEARDSDQPFFLQVAFSAPHTPLQEPVRWKQQYEGIISDSSRLQFAAAMTHMDNAIGQIMEALEQEKLKQNTLVLFMSDNGAQEGWHPEWQYGGKYGPNPTLGSNDPLKGWKTSNYEGGIRVPAVLYWSHHLDSSTLLEPVSVMEIMPTFLAVAGVEQIPEEVEGKNIWPVITEEETMPERTIYVRGHLQESVVTDEWKLIRTRQDNGKPAYELYHIAEDPSEQYNVIRQFPDVTLRLKQRLQKEFRQDAEKVNYTR